MAGFEEFSATTFHSNSPESAPSGELISTLCDQADLQELVAEYVQAMPRRIREVRKTWVAGDAVSFRRLVHQLKGTAGGYGFMAISQAAAELEASLDATNDHRRIKSAMERLLTLCGMARATASKNQGNFFG